MSYFKLEEFACTCCGKKEMHIELLEMLDLARSLSGKPIIITSGYRCKHYNREIGGSDTSSHLEGLAADIACTDSSNRYNMLNALKLAGFTRIGINKRFIHVDIDKNKDQQVIWVY